MEYRSNMTFYVSVKGDDRNTGTADAPAATLYRALELVRKSRTSTDEPVQIYVTEGKYCLEHPLKLGPDDSNILFKADKNTILTGARTLGKLDWKHYHDGVMMTDIEKGLKIDQLFIAGKQQILARYPDYDPKKPLQGCTTADQIKNRSQNWKSPEGGYIRALHCNKWGGNSYTITGKDSDSALGVSVKWAGDNNRGSGFHLSYLVAENIFEELDSEREWFYDAENGKLYNKPEDSSILSDAYVEAAIARELIRICGESSENCVKNVTFDGFILENTARTTFVGNYVPLLRGDWCVVRSGAVFIENTENVAFQNGILRNIGGNGIFVSGHNVNVTIDNNDMVNIGASGVLFVGMPDSCREPSFWDHQPKPETEKYYVHKASISDTEAGPVREHYPRECTVSNCHIKNIGIWEKQSSQVEISVAYKIAVLHNTLNIGPRAGININDGTFGGHEIAYNDIFDVQLETDDHGMFNSWGRDRFWSYDGYDTEGKKGSLKEPYSLLDCIDSIMIHDNRMHFGGRLDGGSTFGIDLDDGSTNYRIYNNLCLNMGIKLREGFHRNVYNNIIVNGQINLHCTYENSCDRITGNIVIKDMPYSLAATDRSRFEISKDIINKNWFYNFGMRVSFPDFWDDLGYDSDSVPYDQPPVFKQTDQNDYTVTNERAAALIGFENFPMNHFGKPGCKDVCPVCYKDFSDNNYKLLHKKEWFGALLSEINDAIMSSTGAGSTNGVYIEKINPRGKAFQYGLKQNDVIKSINGTAVCSIMDFISETVKYGNGSSVVLGIVRNQMITNIVFVVTCE